MATVFVSHSSEDGVISSEIAAALRGRGHTVWLDQTDLPAGDSLASSIEAGIVASDVFLLLHSDSAIRKGWVSLEWQAALERTVAETDYRFVVAVLDDTPLPLLLRGRKWIDLRGNSAAVGAEGFTQVLDAVGPIPAPEPPATPPRSSKAVVWVFDDEERWTEGFTQRHGDTFTITTFNDASALLTAVLTGDELPDILLLDLYAPRGRSPEGELREAESCVREMIAAEVVLRGDVDRAWHPAGVDIVEAVREFYPASRLPIAMHTQQGLALLREDLLEQLESLDVGWLIKNRFSPETDRLVLDRLAMRSGRPLPAGRPRVLIIDDNPAFIEAFTARHSEHYLIRALSSEAEVMPTLRELEMSGEFPDLFVVDMYYPRTTPTAAADIAYANGQLRDFAVLEERAQTLVAQCYEPLGLSVLRKIRRHVRFPELPIIMYSQSGLLTIGDHGFQEIERLDAGWLLKDRYDARTEEVLVCGELMRARLAARRRDRDGVASRG